MPTAARLVAALCLALLALAVSFEVMPRMPESTDFGYFLPLNFALGLICGWVVMGRHTGLGFVGAINNGIAGAAVLVFWGLAVQGTYEMFRLAMNHRYHNPLEAIYGIFELSVGYGQVLIAPVILATLVIGGALSGIVTDFTGRMWR